MIIFQGEKSNYNDCNNDCAVLKENCPHRLGYLNTWAPVGGDVWGRLRRYGLDGGIMFLETGFESLCLTCKFTCCTGWFYVSLVQAIAIREEGTSVKKIPPP